jgi:hypothetical protein
MFRSLPDTSRHRAGGTATCPLWPRGGSNHGRPQRGSGARLRFIAGSMSRRAAPTGPGACGSRPSSEKWHPPGGEAEPGGFWVPGIRPDLGARPRGAAPLRRTVSTCPAGLSPSSRFRMWSQIVIRELLGGREGRAAKGAGHTGAFGEGIHGQARPGVAAAVGLGHMLDEFGGVGEGSTAVWTHFGHISTLGHLWRMRAGPSCMNLCSDQTGKPTIAGPSQTKVPRLSTSKPSARCRLGCPEHGGPPPPDDFPGRNAPPATPESSTPDGTGGTPGGCPPGADSGTPRVRRNRSKIPRDLRAGHRGRSCPRSVPSPTGSGSSRWLGPAGSI